MAHRAERMLETHPRRPHGDTSDLAGKIKQLYSCAQACTSCADACLGEDEVEKMVRCIRICWDCADVCTTTGALLSRQTETDQTLLRGQVQACLDACRICAAECERHAQGMEHCRVCAESCRQCEEACRSLLSTISA